MRPADALARKHLFIDAAGRHVNSPDRPRMFDAITKPVLDLARTCPTYYVAADMVTLAEAAARSLPKTTITETILPSREGWMLYDEPIAAFRPDRGESFEMDGTPVVGMAWTCMPTPLGENSAGDLVIMPGAPLKTCVWLFPLAESPSSRLIVPVSAIWREMGSDLDDSFAADKSLERKFYATHLLMQQTLARVETEQPDRAARRRAERAGLPPSDLVILRLRRTEKAPGDGPGDIIARTHRWLVSGHWRQQWYPSTRTHRPVWISPHVKGPADKPFVAKARVVAWTH